VIELLDWLRRRVIAAVSALRLGFATGFRLRGAYWRWRLETAFGTDPGRMPDARERREAMVDYLVWTHRMRKLMRSRR
jgi:hypothetical protein